MAGHSKWANIKHRKGAQDKKRAGMFTKLVREIIVSARTGQADPAFNPRLRAAIAAAKAQSLPKDRIENAIRKGSGELGEGESYEEMRYEGYAPGGVALIIDCLTDNRNRTASDLRSILGKGGGNLGETGSVSFMFRRIGLIQYPAKTASVDAMFEAALDAGASDCESDEETHEISTEPDQLHQVREGLSAKFGDPEVARLSWKPGNTVPVDAETARSLFDLIETLEDYDDVQYVSANYDIPEDIAQQLAQAS